MNTPLNTAVIGCGGMGRGFIQAVLAEPKLRLSAVCDRDPAALARAGEIAPQARQVRDSAAIFADPATSVVVLATLADARPALVRAALAAGKHVIAEKPLAATVADEESLLAAIEASGLVVAVNIFNRNAWYHRLILDFIASGEIGDLAVVRVRHQTPGMLPGGGHEPEGPPFHDCGMHYVDVARWYAGAEYATWHAQGICLWDHAVPWWINAHGTFANGVVFDITQGFIHGHLAEKTSISCGLEAIGTRGVAWYSHDFNQVDAHLRGVSKTLDQTGPYGGKKLDVMVDRVAQAILTGQDTGYPKARDSVIASRVSQHMLDAARYGAPMRGTAHELGLIRQRQADQRSADAARAAEAKSAAARAAKAAT